MSSKVFLYQIRNFYSSKSQGKGSLANRKETKSDNDREESSTVKQKALKQKMLQMILIVLNLFNSSIYSFVTT